MQYNVFSRELKAISAKEFFAPMLMLAGSLAPSITTSASVEELELFSAVRMVLYRFTLAVVYTLQRLARACASVRAPPMCL